MHRTGLLCLFLLAVWFRVSLGNRPLSAAIISDFFVGACLDVGKKAGLPEVTHGLAVVFVDHRPRLSNVLGVAPVQRKLNHAVDVLRGIVYVHYYCDTGSRHTLQANRQPT